MSAYSEKYLDGAMDCLGEAFDYAVNCCEIDPDLFLSALISSGFVARFQAGEPKVIAGMSGTELAIETLFAIGLRDDFPPAQIEYSLSPEYWCGWVLAYCQWKTGVSFQGIRRIITMREVVQLYHPLHEASEDRFVEEFMLRAKERQGPTRLQAQRKLSGFTQRELASLAEVNLRTLQQYENRSKDINKASAGTVRALAQALGVPMEELLELT